MSDIAERNNGIGNLCEGVGSVRLKPYKIIQKRFKLCIASLNVGTMHGRAIEVVETLARKRTDICAVQETHSRDCSTQMITGKHCRYKILWSGDNSGLGEVDILVAEKWIKKIISVDITSSQHMSLLLLFAR